MIRHIRWITVLCIASFLSFGQVALAQNNSQNNGNSYLYEESIWSRPDRGFYWTPDPKEAPTPQASAASNAKARPIQSLKNMDEIKLELNRLRDRAILDPSDHNLKAFLEANKYWMDVSERFAQNAARMAWQNPELDQNTKRPFANAALLSQDTRERAQKIAFTRQTAQSYGIVFFYRSDCSFCHEQAPILKQLQQRYGLSVLPVSLDGGPINEFNNAVPNNGFDLKLTDGQGVQVTPSLFLVAKQGKQHFFLGAGFQAEDQIIARIQEIQTQTNSDRTNQNSNGQDNNGERP